MRLNGKRKNISIYIHVKICEELFYLANNLNSDWRQLTVDKS